MGTRADSGEAAPDLEQAHANGLNWSDSVQQACKRVADCEYGSVLKRVQSLRLALLALQGAVHDVANGVTGSFAAMQDGVNLFGDGKFDSGLAREV